MQRYKYKTNKDSEDLQKFNFYKSILIIVAGFLCAVVLLARPNALFAAAGTLISGPNVTSGGGTVNSTGGSSTSGGGTQGSSSGASTAGGGTAGGNTGASTSGGGTTGSNSGASTAGGGTSGTGSTSGAGTGTNTVNTSNYAPVYFGTTNSGGVIGGSSSSVANSVLGAAVSCTAGLLGGSVGSVSSMLSGVLSGTGSSGGLGSAVSSAVGSGISSAASAVGNALGINSGSSGSGAAAGTDLTQTAQNGGLGNSQVNISSQDLPNGPAEAAAADSGLTAEDQQMMNELDAQDAVDQADLESALDTGDISSIGSMGDTIIGSMGGTILQMVGGGAVPTTDSTTHSNQKTQINTQNKQLGIQTSDQTRWNFLDCAARAMAKMALQQMTASTINWIGSGFNQKPSFVQNYNQFFRSIANSAVNTFINTSLATLSSPYKAQVSTVLANSYSNTLSSSPAGPACTLQNSTSNPQGFMTNFSQGGWAALLSFTTQPQNNPFGAYMYASAAMNSQIQDAQQQKATELANGKGFLNDAKIVNCHDAVPDENGDISWDDNQIVRDKAGTTDGTEEICDLAVVTPGSTIADSLSKTMGVTQDSLVNAKFFDEIIAQLLKSLVTNVINNGVSVVSGNGAGTFGSNPAYGSIDSSQVSNVVIQNANTYINNTQQAQNIFNNNISLIRPLLPGITTLQQCWYDIATSTNHYFTPNIKNLARRILVDSTGTTTAISSQISTYYGNIPIMNNSISTLNQYLTQMNAAIIAKNTLAISSTTMHFESDASGGLFVDNNAMTRITNDHDALQSAALRIGSATSAGLSRCGVLKNCATVMTGYYSRVQQAQDNDYYGNVAMTPQETTCQGYQTNP